MNRLVPCLYKYFVGPCGPQCESVADLTAMTDSGLEELLPAGLLVQSFLLNVMTDAGAFSC